MRKTLLMSACAAVIGLSAVATASAQTAGAPANNQTNVTGPASSQTNASGAATSDKGAMSAMNKMKKKSKKTKDTTGDSGAADKGMEKK
jgi:hypothetical protein